AAGGGCLYVGCPSPDRPLADLDGCIGRLEGNLVTTIAERLVGGSAAAAKGKRRLARQVVFFAIGVHHLATAVRIVYAQRTVIAHRNRDLRHETPDNNHQAFKLSHNERS